MNYLKSLNLDINNLKLTANDSLRPRNIAILATGLGLSYCAYKTYLLYLKRRKYRHIPGPPTNGFEKAFRPIRNRLK